MEFLIRHKTVVLFIVFLLFCIISLSLQSGQTNKFTHTVEGAGSGIVMPFKRAFNGITNGISGLFEGMSKTNYDALKKEVVLNRKKLQRYDTLLSELADIRRENSRLRRVLEYKNRMAYETIAAEVISKDPDNWFRAIVVDRGEDDGIKINMPVVTYLGEHQVVIGKIVEVRSSRSRIRPLISPRMKIGVKLLGSGYPGLLYGDSINSEYCLVDYLSREARIKKGDIFVTSGQGGIFPRGILVGKVVRFKILETGSYQRATIKPIIDYDLLETVFILKKDPDMVLRKMIEENK